MVVAAAPSMAVTLPCVTGMQITGAAATTSSGAGRGRASGQMLSSLSSGGFFFVVLALHLGWN